MAWCVSYSSLEAVDWSLYKYGDEGLIQTTMHAYFCMGKYLGLCNNGRYTKVTT